jgi:lipopolysaccharide export system permease protein
MLDRYLFIRLLQSQLALTLILSSVIWLVQALDLIDKALTAGTSPLETLMLSTLVLPRVLTFTIAPALLITVISQMVRLLQDYEYFALTAAGLSPLRVLRPMLLLGAVVMVVQGLLAFYISPIAMKTLKLSSFESGSQIALADLQPGAFKDLKFGMTAFTSGQDSDGNWLDLMIYDMSKPQRPVTYLAKRARISARNGEPYFILQDGSQLIGGTDRRDQDDGQIIRFSQYLLPLSQPVPTQKTRITFNRNHMLIHQLLNPSAHGVTSTARITRMKGRGLELISNLAQPIIFMLIGFAVITAGGISRSGYSQRVMAAVLLAIVFQIGVIALADVAVEEDAPTLIFIWPVLFLGGLMAFIQKQNDPDMVKRLFSRMMGRAT